MNFLLKWQYIWLKNNIIYRQSPIAIDWKMLKFLVDVHILLLRNITDLSIDNIKKWQMVL